MQVTTADGPKGHFQLTYNIDTDALNRIAETHLGKTILISNRKEWSDERIIEGYRSQYLIEMFHPDYPSSYSLYRGNWAA